MASRVLRGAVGLAVEHHRAAEGGGDAEDRLHQLGAPRADQAGEAEDLAAAGGEADAGGGAGDEQVADDQDRLARAGRSCLGGEVVG